MDDKKKERLAAALSKAAAERNTDRKKFIEHDKYLTAKREGKIPGFPPPENIDIGLWQRMQQDVAKKRGFLKKSFWGKYRYEEPQKTYPDRPAEKLVTGKIKRKRSRSISI